MTVQQLMDILKDRDPNDIVCVETSGGTIAVDDDWSRCYLGEGDQGFCLFAFSELEDYNRAKA
jgi:hypothetical protein